MLSFKNFGLAVIFFPLLSVAYSQPKSIGSVPIKIHLKNGSEKIVQVVHIQVDKNSRVQLSQNIRFLLTQKKMQAELGRRHNKKVELGMNSVSVLDQGTWGTCATFAATAAVDALLSLGGENSVSQLCNLELGRTLENPDEDGGWDGSFGFSVLNQISSYGYLDKAYQHAVGCGGLKHYPLYDDSNNGVAMPQAEFMAHSKINFTSHDWRPILSFAGDFTPVTNSIGDQALMDVKDAITAKRRVVFGTLLVPSEGDAGAQGNYHKIENDTWVLTPEIRQDVNDSELLAGHEMVIEGFDDRACATYLDEGLQKKQCGILHLRNSWSSAAGDNGDYYMTYDYFKVMALEAYAVGKGVR